jgi:hypothetical protein
MCCEEHTIAFDAGFFRRNLPAHGFSVLSFSDPYSPELLNAALSGEMDQLPSDGDELVVCAWSQADLGGSRQAQRPGVARFNSVS